MAIEKIIINDFTVFENIDIEFNDGVNIFIGENGTGKTHLLKLLYAAHLTRVENSPSVNSVFGEDFDIDVTIINKLSDESIEEGYFNIVGDNNSKVTVVSNKPYNPVFIPAKDMLTHGRLEKDYAERNLPFDRTLIEILIKAGVSTVRKINDEMLPIITSIAKIIEGTIVYKNDRYYVQKANGMLIGFDMEAEGYKKFGLLYRLIETGYFKKGSVLLWDEPEANINPKRIPEMVEILLEFVKNGVQVFIATHHYELAKYFDIRCKESKLILFHSFYKTEAGVKCESNNDFEKLSVNEINKAVDILMDEMLGRN